MSTRPLGPRCPPTRPTRSTTRRPDDSPHEQAIDKAADAGFMGAADYQAFAPERSLPRRQLASVLVRWVDPRVR